MKPNTPNLDILNQNHNANLRLAYPAQQICLFQSLKASCLSIDSNGTQTETSKCPSKLMNILGSWYVANVPNQGICHLVVLTRWYAISKL